MLTHIMSETPKTRTLAVQQLRKGMTGRAVRRLAFDLAALGHLPCAHRLALFDKAMEAAVRRFQMKGMGANGLPLAVDGVVGPQTRFGIDLALGREHEAPNNCLPPPLLAPPLSGAAPGWRALQKGLDEIAAGAQEIGGPGCGPYCARYLAAAGRREGTDWSVAFVAWCLDVPGSGDAAGLMEHALSARWDVQPTQPEPGDILLWTSERADGFVGHAGFVAGVSRGIVHTLEGGRTPFVEFFHYSWPQLARLVTVVRPRTGQGSAESCLGSSERA